MTKVFRPLRRTRVRASTPVLFPGGIFLVCAGFGGLTLPVYSQVLQEETLPNPDAHELPDASPSHLFGSWGGVRTELLERGLKLDVHYISDSLWNIESPEEERLASFNRFRGTLDIDSASWQTFRGSRCT